MTSERSGTHEVGSMIVLAMTQEGKSQAEGCVLLSCEMKNLLRFYRTKIAGLVIITLETIQNVA